MASPRPETEARPRLLRRGHRRPHPGGARPDRVVAAYIEDNPQYARLQAYIRDGNSDGASSTLLEIQRDLQAQGWGEQADEFRDRFLSQWDDFFPGVTRPR